MAVQVASHALERLLFYGVSDPDQTRIGYIKEFYDLFVKIWNKFCNFTDNIKG